MRAKLVLVLCAALTIGAALPGRAVAAPRNTSVVVAQESEEGGGATETGPPWTYQMARITLVLLLFLALAIGLLYYRLVVRRRRGET